MKAIPYIIVDGRDAVKFVEQLLTRRLGYVPKWQPGDTGMDTALVQILARFLETITQRLNQSPEKNKLAFFDLLGLTLIPAQAARAPVVFEPSLQSKLAEEALKNIKEHLPYPIELPVQQTFQYRAPAGSQVAAPAPAGRIEQIVFETEQAIGITTAQLKDVVSLEPDQGQYIDHAQMVQSCSPIRLFQNSTSQNWQDIPHEIYLTHNTLLALAGKGTVSIDFKISRITNHVLNISWEYWDGLEWCRFTILSDNTRGLSQSGVLKLQFPVDDDSLELNNLSLKSVKTNINGMEAFWIRGRLNQPIQPGSEPPEIEGLTLLNTTIHQEFKIELVGELSKKISEADIGMPFYIKVQNESKQGLMNVPAELYSPDDPDLPRAKEGLTNKRGIFGCNYMPKPEQTYEIRLFGKQGISCSYTLDEWELFIEIPSLWATVTVSISGLAPDKAFADGMILDISKSFYPFGVNPQPGATFYFSQEEAFSKPGANLQIYISRVISAQDKAIMTTSTTELLEHKVVWEYWNGSEWTKINSLKPSQELIDLDNTGIIEFIMPEDIARTTVNGQDGLWIRVNLVSGGFGYIQEVDLNTNTVTNIIQNPPVLSDFCIGYTWDSNARQSINPTIKLSGQNLMGELTIASSVSNTAPSILNTMPMVSSIDISRTLSYNPAISGLKFIQQPGQPEQIITYGDFQYEIISPGKTFLPFRRVGDQTPAMYLGFDEKFPSDRIGLFFDIEENPNDTTREPMEWEYWNGGWQKLAVEDETRNLRVPGILSFIGPADSLLLIRFNRERYWIRGRLCKGNSSNSSSTLPVVNSKLFFKKSLFGTPIINNIFVNCVWASQQRIFNDTPLGSSSGEAKQIFRISQTPVLDGEYIEVRELAGSRAEVEWRILAREISGGNQNFVSDLEKMLGNEGFQADIKQGDLRLRQATNKKVKEVWVHWQERRHLFFSGPKDRHYVIDRGQGLVFFGDGIHGKIPPAGAAILVKQFRTGGGRQGNVSAGAINQLLTGIPGVQKVFNPCAAEGGATNETIEAFCSRAPKTFRHLGRAITMSDYEAMAYEASPAVAVARVMPFSRIGLVKLLIIPHGQEARPKPSFGLREGVRKYIEAHAPADISQAQQILVVGPDYFPIEVYATIVPLAYAEAGLVERRARGGLEEFFHPLHGGPERCGWELGRDVFQSDVAALLERIEGVDYIESLTLTMQSQITTSLPQNNVEVPENQIVVAGDLHLTLKGSVL